MILIEMLPTEEDVSVRSTREKPDQNRAMPLFHHTGETCSDVQSRLRQYLYEPFLNTDQFVDENGAAGKGLSEPCTAAG